MPKLKVNYGLDFGRITDDKMDEFGKVGIGEVSGCIGVDEIMREI